MILKSTIYAVFYCTVSADLTFSGIVQVLQLVLLAQSEASFRVVTIGELRKAIASHLNVLFRMYNSFSFLSLSP